MRPGQGQLIVRPDARSSDKTINAVLVDDKGVKIWSRRKAEKNEVINRILARYNRDWTKTGDDAYTATYEASDATSQSNYGLQERPELFKFDFITSATMAAAVCNFYLSQYAARRWRHEFSVLLDCAAVEFGDDLTLGFADNEVGTVIDAGIVPGDEGKMSVVKLIVEV
jgi:hypothetical protein